MNRIHVAPTYPRELSDICNLYFHLFVSFYKHLCNSTVWALGYVVPYHADLLYQNKKNCVWHIIYARQGSQTFWNQTRTEAMH